MDFSTSVLIVQAFVEWSGGGLRLLMTLRLTRRVKTMTVHCPLVCSLRFSVLALLVDVATILNPLELITLYEYSSNQGWYMMALGLST